MAAKKNDKSSTRADEIRQVIEAEIFSGSLRPGTRLDEESLAARFGLSRTPVREAILQLVYSGLVVKQPRQGAEVAPLDLHRMVQMFEVMSDIEGLCARYAARRMSAEEKAALQAMHDRSGVLCQARQLDEYYAVNHAFHEAVYRGSHNVVLQDMARSLFSRLAPYRRYQLNHPKRIDESCAEHGEVLDAIIAADPDRAQAAMRKHVTIQADIFSEFVSIMR